MTPTYRLGEQQLMALFDALKAQGRTIIGPRVEDAAIVYAELNHVHDLPRGWVDEQRPGMYRIRQTTSPLWFGFAAPVRPLKHWFHPERETLYSIRSSKRGLAVHPAPIPARKLAIFGARACDLAGLERLDAVLLTGPHPDARYAVRRQDTLLIAANCTTPATTCFCTSMGTGPRAANFDLAFTETMIDGEHAFLLEVGTAQGNEALAGLTFPTATSDEVAHARRETDAASRKMQRHVDPEAARDVLKKTLEHSHYEKIAERCLACANCTASCPTCFCTSIEDTRSLDATQAERIRTSDSCFNTEFSYVHGGSVRQSLASRYRQWLTHKFSTWYDQFGTSGCVGCGRCISWCPVGIDVTEELAHFEQVLRQPESEAES